MDNKLIIHHPNGTETAVDISPSQAASIAADIKDRCGKRHQEPEPFEGKFNVFWMKEEMSNRWNRKVRRFNKTWRRMHSPGILLHPYRCTADGKHYFHGVISVPRSAWDASEYIGMRFREIKAALMFFTPSCQKCKWCIKELAKKGAVSNRKGRSAQWHCKKLRDHFWTQPDKQALECEHYKRKGKSK